MSYYKFGYLSFLMVLLIGLLACEPKKKETAEENAEAFDQAQKAIDDQIQEVVYEIPSPSEIPFLLEATGAEYNNTLIHNNNRVSQYTTVSDKAAVNLGIYASDIGYLVSYGKVQKALTYMGTAKKLADKLGISGAFDVSLIERFESNLSRRDSLAELLNSSIRRAEDYLKVDGRDRVASLIVAGSFIEGLYIATQLVKTYPKDILPEDSRNLILTPLIRVILDQQEACKDLASLLKKLERSAITDELLENLKLLNKSYAALNIENQIKNNRADLVLSDKTLADITSRVANMRSALTD